MIWLNKVTISLLKKVIESFRPDALKLINQLIKELNRSTLTENGYPILHEAIEKVFYRVKKAAWEARLHPMPASKLFVSYLTNGKDSFYLEMKLS
jgi:hypothetical protein